jgi:hypothetical protein
MYICWHTGTTGKYQCQCLWANMASRLSRDLRLYSCCLSLLCWKRNGFWRRRSRYLRTRSVLTFLCGQPPDPMLWDCVCCDGGLLSPYNPVVVWFPNAEVWLQEAAGFGRDVLGFQELCGHRSLRCTTGIKHSTLFTSATTIFRKSSKKLSFPTLTLGVPEFKFCLHFNCYGKSQGQINFGLQLARFF